MSEPDALLVAQLQLADQQARAAWVSAFAAIGQAIAAALAIYWTIRLARDADRRERLAAIAETNRELDRERLRADDAAAAGREAYNRPIDRIAETAADLFRALDQEIEQAARYKAENGVVTGAFGGVAFSTLVALVGRQLAVVDDLPLERAMRDLLDAMQIESMTTTWPEHLERLEAYRARVRSGLERLTAMRRRSPGAAPP